MIFRSLASPDPVRHSKRRRRRRRKKKKEEKKKKKRKKRKKQNYICTLPIDRPWRKICYIICCFWASYFFACLRGVARSLGTQYFLSLFACAGVARPLVNHIHHLYFHGFLSGFPISSSITNCISIVIISGSSISSGSGSSSGSSSSSNSSR